MKLVMLSVLVLLCLLIDKIVLGENAGVTFKQVSSYNKEGRFMTKDDIEKSSVNVLKPIVFIIGGLTNVDKKGDSWSNDLQEAYLQKLIHNVFIVDWNLTSPPKSESISKAHSAGLTVADFIGTIFNKTGEAYLDIHLVGVSLGCEVAVSAASRFSQLHERKINRITGLDPAYYLISDGGEPRQLSEENADFVDVVHTNLNETNKELEQTGHVDFYVDSVEESPSNGIPKSTVLFAKSVNSFDIKATECDNLENFRKGSCNKGEQIIFGENVKANARGQYFLKY